MTLTGEEKATYCVSRGDAIYWGALLGRDFRERSLEGSVNEMQMLLNRGAKAPELTTGVLILDTHPWDAGGQSLGCEVLCAPFRASTTLGWVLLDQPRRAPLKQKGSWAFHRQMSRVTQNSDGSVETERCTSDTWFCQATLTLWLFLTVSSSPKWGYWIPRS